MVETSVVRDVSTATSATRPPSRAPPARSVSVRRPGVRSSSSGEGVDILDAVRQQRLTPALTAVVGAEDLAAARRAGDVAGVGGIQGEGHHGGAGLDPVVHAGPALAEVGGAIERAVLAAGGRTETGIQRA